MVDKMHPRFIPVLAFLINLERGWFSSLLASEWPETRAELDLADAGYAAVPVTTSTVWVFATRRPASGEWTECLGGTLATMFYESARDRVFLSEVWAEPVSILRQAVG